MTGTSSAGGLAATLPVPAAYFDGKTSRRHTVTLSPTGAGLHVLGEGIDRLERWSNIEVSDRVGEAARFVRFADGAFCEIVDGESWDVAVRPLRKGPSWVSRLEASWRAALASAVFFSGLCVAGYVFGLPWAARLAAHAVPISAVRLLTAQSQELLDRTLFEPTGLSPERISSIEARVRALRLPAGDDAEVELLFRKSPSAGANAFALPGGTVFVTDELVALAADDDEVVAVVAHELGHVHERHGLQQMLQSTVVGLMTAWLFGDVSSIVAGVPATLLDASYSRDHERAADAYASRLLRSNGLDAALLATILGKLDEAHGSDEAMPDYLSSHPATAERIEALTAGDAAGR